MKQSSADIGNVDGAWLELRAYVEQLGANNILLVTLHASYQTCGAAAIVRALFADKKITRVSDYSENPKAEEVVKLLQKLDRHEGYDLILAIGGGSAMDCAKLIKAYWHSPDPVYGHLLKGQELTPCDLPLAAVPTTAGSGSEATHFAVVYLGNEKISVAHKKLLPDRSFLVPSLLKSLPRHVAASCAIDALCQGIESYWSIHSTPESRELAAEAIQKSWRAMIPAVLDKKTDDLQLMAEASHLAGKAINLTKTTAPHAVSYALTTFFGVSHGHAVGLLMPLFLVYNDAVTSSDCLDPRGVAWVKNSVSQIARMLGYDKVEHLADGLTKRLGELGLETSLVKLGIQSDQDRALIIQHGFNPQRVNNNPRKLTQSALLTMLQCKSG
ncbi:MAG: phosphonoacetaldehyde reductase [Akkermansiaceae bacterium]|nr:phosphonoacetaldehyde reductase [Akkermansiaceae bacterium]